VPSVHIERLSPRVLERIAIVLGYGTLLLLYLPILWLMLMSISGQPLTGIPGEFTLKWYEALFKSNEFRVRDPILLSIGLGLITMIACGITATLVGRLLPRLRRRGRLLFLFLIPLMVPGIVLGASIFLYYRVLLDIKMGLWSLAVAHVIWAFPFALLAQLVVSSRFDHRLADAAADLGANSWQRFWYVEVPLIRSGIYASLFFSFLLSINELDRSIFMRSGQITLPLYLWIQSGSHATSIPLIYAMSTIVTIISVALTFIAVRGMFRNER
jgi:ABC-type spermidine/putrescine transport system permease subunit II